jgi:hypothetical protein
VSRSVSKKGTPALIIPKAISIPDAVSAISKKTFTAMPSQPLAAKKVNVPRSPPPPTTRNATVPVSRSPQGEAVEPESLSIRQDIFFLETKNFINRALFENYVKDAQVPLSKNVSKLQALKEFFKWKKE